MQGQRFEPLEVDDAIYYNDNTEVIVVSYVDNSLRFGLGKPKLKASIRSLKISARLNDLGEV